MIRGSTLLRLSVLGICLVLMLVWFVYVLSTRRARQGREILEQVYRDSPEWAKRIDEQIQTLKKENLKTSLANLWKMDSFFPGVMWLLGQGSGTPIELPPWPAEGNSYPRVVSSSRRFVKAYQELAGLSKRKAAQLVSTEVQKTLPQYHRLVQECLEEFKDSSAPEARSETAGPLPLTDDGVHPTLTGMRLKLLALCLIMGNLELTDSRETVAMLVKEALQQYSEFSNAYKSNIFRATRVINDVSLYNRQILATALVGTLSDPQTRKMAEELMARYEVSEELTLYDAQLTTYEWPRTTARPDFSRGRVKVRYYKNVPDEVFRQLVTLTLNQ